MSVPYYDLFCRDETLYSGIFFTAKLAEVRTINYRHTLLLI